MRIKPYRKDATDEELAADVRMIADELHKTRTELIRRGYEVEVTSYTPDAITVGVERVTRVAI